MKRLIGVFILSVLSLVGFAQTAMTNSAGTGTIETVTNAATGTLTVRNGGPKQNTTLSVTVTKTSGTLGGTITLQGSVDNSAGSYKAITLVETATALPTYTVTDVASQTFILSLNANRYLYYRWSWTGTGTMAGSMTGKILSH